jgi:hypothetical protein
MANSLYNYGQEQFAKAGINWTTDTIKCALVDNTYTPNLATDQFYSTISAKVVGTPQAIASPTATGGVCKASNVTFTAVTGNQVKYVVFYKDTGTTTTSPLICCIDTATGLPVTPNGGNITVQVDATNGVFTLN